jgi:hypothetical protein
VSSVVTDFSLANMAWLKAPMGAPSLPTTELLAYSYAALRPPEPLLAKFLQEMDRLERTGKLMPRDHQLLRSSTVAQEELMRLTLGQEEALTEETVTETLARVTEEIRKEDQGLLREESEKHEVTRADRDAAKRANEVLLQRMFWRIRRHARVAAWAASTFLISLVLIGVVAGIGVSAHNPIVSYLLLAGSITLGVITVISWIYGTTARKLHADIERRYFQWAIRRESKQTGLDLAVDT